MRVWLAEKCKHWWLRLVSTEMLSVELLRQQLGTVPKDTRYIDGLSQAERDEYIAKANLIHTNIVFQRTADYLIQQQVEFTVKNAQTMDQILFGRATINGIALMREEIERLNALYQESIKAKEKFDEFEII